MNPHPVAYFSMEIAVREDMPTYAGGLGVLAGDTLRAAADAGLPITAITLLHRAGYYRQSLDADGTQHMRPESWSPEAVLEALDLRVALTLHGRRIVLRPWRYRIEGVGGTVPVYFLDTDLAENDPADRALCRQLYAPDPGARLRQEAVLGIGGVRVLRALGLASLQAYHMNEGHSALLAVELLREIAPEGTLGPDDVERVRERCVFTTHTPVPAGHDQFPTSVHEPVLGPLYVDLLHQAGCHTDHTLNLTHVALRMSRYVNGVAMRHGEVSRDLFPGYPVRSITNGVHAVTWVAAPMAALFDAEIPDWRRDNFQLRYALGISDGAVADAHRRSKATLLETVAERTGRRLDPGVFTIGFGRRAARYKRSALVFRDLGALRALARSGRRLQFVFGGKAHPADEDGRAAIRTVFEAARALGDEVPVVYVPDFDWHLASRFVAGVDLWLNTPRPPLEASGTSGMKAALNGVPSLSVLDGWWVEGHVEGVTGWAVGDGWHPGDADDGGHEAESIYRKLGEAILPCFYEDPARWRRIMRSTIALNGAFFNAQRMLEEYRSNAYGL